MAVSDRFKTLLDRIEPSPTTQQLVESHRASVASHLKSAFAANQVKLIGSHARGTAISNVSDVDLLLVLSRSEVTWGGARSSSQSVLGNVRRELQARFRNTDIGRDGQAVVVDFGDGRHPVDVVPGVYLGPGQDNYPVYEIPDGDGGWMQTSPEVHNRFIAAANQRSGNKLTGVAQLLKFWRGTRNAPVSSFHLELVLADSGICTVPKSYAAALAEALALLAQRQGRALQDPLGISGWVSATNTEAKRQQLAASLRESAEHARAAVSSDAYGSYPEAYRQWDIVFNGQFPKQ
jgi:predicted nucleotidyltransferase